MNLEQINDFFLSTANVLHIGLLIYLVILAWSFWRDSKSQNGMNRRLMWVTLAVASGHLWSIMLITVWGPSLQATLWRNVQLIFTAGAFAFLQHYTTNLKTNGPKQSDNTIHQEKSD